MIMIMMIMKNEMAITQPIFKLGPQNFAGQQMQIIPTDEDNDDDDNDDDDDDDIDDNDHDDHENQNGHNSANF